MSRSHALKVSGTASRSPWSEMLLTLMVAQRIPPGTRRVGAKSLGLMNRKVVAYGFCGRASARRPASAFAVVVVSFAIGVVVEGCSLEAGRGVVVDDVVVSD
jgi:hypothetical protein